MKHDTSLNARQQRDALSPRLHVEEPPTQGVELSIVIPCYNEQRRLPKTVADTMDWCARHAPRYELLLADDGSTDDTLALARRFAAQASQVRCLACPHLGKGATVRTGMLNAVGWHVLFMDADGATPLEEIPKLMAALEAGAHVAIGSRVPQHPDETRVMTSAHRKFIGRTFAALVNIFAIPGFGDTQCGFKMFRQTVVQPIFSRQKLHGFAFDVEILYIARQLGLRAVEVPVNWVNQDGSKVNLISDSWKMLLDILRIRWIHRHERDRNGIALARYSDGGKRT